VVRINFKNTKQNIFFLKKKKKKKSKKAYVTGNNVYVLLETGESLTVTNDGSLNIINGIPAWVYEGLFFVSVH